MARLRSPLLLNPRALRFLPRPLSTPSILQSQHLRQSSSTSSTTPTPFSFPSHHTPNSKSSPSPSHPPSPFPAKKPWPPDLSNLKPNHQFALERKYRRRMKLKYARPRWVKLTKLVQWGVIGFVLVYGVLFMDWGQEETPFRGIREWFHEKIEGIWTRPEPRGLRREGKDE